MSPGEKQRDRSDPFEQLEKSHRKLQENLAALRAAVVTLNERPDDAEALAAVIEVSGFVDRTVVRHEKDEEESLFPRLRDDAELAPLIEQLEREHREHEKLHERLRAIAGACDGALSDEDRARLGALVDELDAAYEKHVDVEEGELFPAAKAALDAATQRAIAEEMQARRGRGGKRR